MSISWSIGVVVGFTLLALWQRNLRSLRVSAAVVNLAVLGQQCIHLANVGRNTFEAVVRQQNIADTFHEGVFAEAKLADAFAREQLVAVYIAALCLGGLAIWPAAAKRGVKADTATTSLEPGNDAQAALK